MMWTLIGGSSVFDGWEQLINHNPLGRVLWNQHPPFTCSSQQVYPIGVFQTDSKCALNFFFQRQQARVWESGWGERERKRERDRGVSSFTWTLLRHLQHSWELSTHIPYTWWEPSDGSHHHCLLGSAWKPKVGSQRQLSNAGTPIWI